jgi:hypothetical protein
VLDFVPEGGGDVEPSAHLLGLKIYADSFGIGAMGRNDGRLFSR